MMRNGNEVELYIWGLLCQIGRVMTLGFYVCGILSGGIEKVDLNSNIYENYFWHKDHKCV